MIQCGSRNLSVVLREIPMDSTILYLDDNQASSTPPPQPVYETLF